MQTNFQKAKEFHQIFELDINDKPQFDVFNKNPKLVKLRMSLIDEEVNELREAMKNKDMKETLDALTDILYVTYGTGVSLGFSMDNAFDLVHQSNMTKACYSEEEAKKTVEWYKKYYKPNTTELRYDTPAYKQSHYSFFNNKRTKFASERYAFQGQRLSPLTERSEIAEGDYWIISNKSTGKILKSINYKPPDFGSMLYTNMISNKDQFNQSIQYILKPDSLRNLGLNLLLRTQSETSLSNTKLCKTNSLVPNFIRSKCCIDNRSLFWAERWDLDPVFIKKCRLSRLSTEKYDCLDHSNLLKQIEDVSGLRRRPVELINNKIIHYMDRRRRTYAEYVNFQKSIKNNPLYREYIAPEKLYLRRGSTRSLTNKLRSSRYNLPFLLLSLFYVAYTNK